MIFTANGLSTRWQRSVQQGQRDSSIHKERQYTEQKKTQNTQNSKQKYKTRKEHKKNIKKHKSSN